MSGAKFSYSLAEQWFHKIALSCSIIPELAFDLEKARFGEAARKLAPTSPVFVAGLARGGTTVLTQILHESGDFASLTYRDLPFPLAPNSWARARLSANRTVVDQERNHNDGLNHNLDSPEAIEEVFWRTFDHRNYILRDQLALHYPSREIRIYFEKYVELICLRYNKTRYLSKNNNNILRISSICSAFSNVIMIHPFREPLQHAASLLDQHKKTSLIQRRDPFRLKFAVMLGHHEFGLGHRPFVFDQPNSIFAMDLETIDYWLLVWIQTYTWLLSQSDVVAARQFFLNYDACCVDVHQLDALSMSIGLARKIGRGKTVMRAARQHIVKPSSQSLYRIALDVYESLLARAALTRFRGQRLT
jgi:hypothetical protein